MYMNPEPLLLPPPTPYTTYIKGIVGILVLIGIYLLLKPYLSLFIKIGEAIKTKLYVSHEKESEAQIGEKLNINKVEKAPAEPHFCYAGEWKGIRQCVQVDKSQCSSKTYSTLSQCVNS
jgi:hypothetical protein